MKDISYKIEIEPYELVFQIGTIKAMQLVLEIEASINDDDWSKKLILKMIGHMEENLSKEEMQKFVNTIKRKAKAK